MIIEYTVCRKPLNFSFVLSNAVVEPVRVQINAIRFIFFEADVRSFEIRTTAWRKRNQNRWHSCLRFSADCMEIQCHKGFHLKPKAAINYTEISSRICKTISIFNEHNFQSNGGKYDWRLSSRLMPSYLWSVVQQWNYLESNFSLMT